MSDPRARKNKAKPTEPSKPLQAAPEPPESEPEDSEAEVCPGRLCPYCGADAFDGGCRHHLASGDDTFPHADGGDLPWAFGGGRADVHTDLVVELTVALADFFKRSGGKPRLMGASPRLARLVRTLKKEAVPDEDSVDGGWSFDEYAELRGFRDYLIDLWKHLVPGLVVQQGEDDASFCSSSYSIVFGRLTERHLVAIGKAIQADIDFLREAAAKPAPAARSQRTRPAAIKTPKRPPSIRKRSSRKGAR